MSSDRVVLVKRLTGMLRTAREFEKLEVPQQAAFRAGVTRLKGQVTDPQLLAILEKITDRIGEPEARAAKKMTLETLTAEAETYAEKDPSLRPAFKAKVRRFAAGQEDPKVIAAAEALIVRVEKVEESEAEAELVKAEAELDAEGGDSA